MVGRIWRKVWRGGLQSIWWAWPLWWIRAAAWRHSILEPLAHKRSAHRTRKVWRGGLQSIWWAWPLWWIRAAAWRHPILDRKSTRLNSHHLGNSDAAFCLEKKGGMQAIGTEKNQFHPVGRVAG